MSLQLSEKIEVRVLEQVVDELLDASRVSEVSLAKNRNILLPFLTDVTEDRVFVLGLSKLDSALVASELAKNTFGDHLRDKSKKIQDLRDGIHLLNTIDVEANLVSCDRRLRRAASRHHVRILCLVEFARKANLGGDLRCHGCLAEGSGSAG